MNIDAVNKEIQQENDRHKCAIADINKKKAYENELHQRKIRMLNNKKEQIRRFIQNAIN